MLYKFPVLKPPQVLHSSNKGSFQTSSFNKTYKLALIKNMLNVGGPTTYPQKEKVNLSKDDWYRNSNWDAGIETAFFQKLKRARNKFEYLRIQASYLSERHPRTALRLLGEAFELGENFDTASAHVAAAEAYLALDQIDDAVESYEAAIAREVEFPTLQTEARIKLPFLIVTMGIEDKYERAIEILDTHTCTVYFHSDGYKWNATKALIMQFYGLCDEAKQFAQAALSAAQVTDSGLRYHRKVGLFRRKGRATKVYEKVEKLAKG